MKTIFLEARHNKNFTLPANVITKLKKYKTLALFTTVQFLDSIPKIKKQLEKANIKVQLIQTKHCQYKAQLLGCSILESKIKAGVDVFLYLGDGLFHPIALKISNNKEISLTKYTICADLLQFFLWMVINIIFQIYWRV